MNKEKCNILKKHKPYLEILSKVNNSFVFVAEYNGEYLFLSDNFSSFFGYDLEIIETLNGENFQKNIHPEDIQILALTQNNLIDYISSLPESERGNYKYIFEFRVLNVEKKYVRVISQQQVLEFNENGDPWLVLGVVDIAPDQSETEQVRLRLINYKTGDIFPFPIAQKDLNISLTTREREILELIKKGMLSKEISDKLSISIHTVNGHRQNILQKLKVDNALEAVEYARKLGLIN